MDLKTRIEVLTCGKCEDMLDCDTCIFSKEAKELYKQIRKETLIELWGRAIYTHDEYIEFEELDNIIDEMIKENK